jgi:hypothetical protein
MIRSSALIPIAAIALTAGCSSTSGGTSAAPSGNVAMFTGSAAAAPAATRKPAPKARSARKPQKKRKPSAIDSCYARPPDSGDIYVWYVVPGLPDSAQELGGEWTWNHATNSCQTSVQIVIATAPQGPGYCTAVGYVSDNPGYDADATPAKRLENVTDESGAAC